MHNIINRGLLSFIALMPSLSGAQQYSSQARPINYDEASAFERSLKANEVPPLQKAEQMYTQPVNKKVPCKLPTTKDQVERRNFRAYWDGQCKNGYAYGLGRDIAISDTHHMEEITMHDGSEDSSRATAVTYDFVNNQVRYHVSGGEYPESSDVNEAIYDTMNGFNVLYTIMTVDRLGNSLGMQFSPFSPVRILLDVESQIVYRFTQNTLASAASPSEVTFISEIINPKTRTPGGVSVVRYGNGQVQHLLIEGSQKSLVQLPDDYLSHLNEKLSEAWNAQQAANLNVEPARQMEREYLHMVCNGKYSISGLDNETSTLICTWRDKFKTPYANALAKYKQQLEEMRQKTEALEQQRQAQQQLAAQQKESQQQLALQQQALNKQQTELAAKEVMDALGALGQQMRNSGQQMLQGVMRQPAPQFTPFAPIGGNRINCINVGAITSCR